MKPRVKCELLTLVTPKGHPPSVMVAHIIRLSAHPHLGAAEKDKLTVTSPVVRIDFHHQIIETENTYYHYMGGRHGT